MQYSAAAVLALAASASAGYVQQPPAGNHSIVYTTEIHKVFTTVCPSSTEITFNGKTYTATASETLTITDCPCTVTKPIVPTSYVVCSTCAPNPPYTPGPPAPTYPAVNPPAPTYPVVNPPAPTYPVVPPPSYPTNNGTVPAPPAPTAPVGTGYPAPPPANPTNPLVVANGANKAMAISGGSLAALFGLVAYLL